MYLLLYVDDMLIAFSDMEEIQRLKAELNKEFEIKDLVTVKRILGMESNRGRKKLLFLSQKGYLLKILDRF